MPVLSFIAGLLRVRFVVSSAAGDAAARVSGGGVRTTVGGCPGFDYAVRGLRPDLRGRIAVRQPDLVGARFAEVDVEVGVQPHGAVFGNVDFQHPAFEPRVELVVPLTLEAV